MQRVCGTPAAASRQKCGKSPPPTGTIKRLPEELALGEAHPPFGRLARVRVDDNLGQPSTQLLPRLQEVRAELVRIALGVNVLVESLERESNIGWQLDRERGGGEPCDSLHNMQSVNTRTRSKQHGTGRYLEGLDAELVHLLLHRIFGGALHKNVCVCVCG